MEFIVAKYLSKTLTEEELIRGCTLEYKAYQKALYDKYAGRMLAVCIRYARDRAEAEDILQDGFIKIFDNISSFKGEGSFEGWIRRIIVNTALNQYRKNSSRNEVYEYEMQDFDATHDEMNAMSKLSEKELLRIIAELPDGYRLVFNLYAIEGYSHKEISEMLLIKESTSRSQLVKARQVLQQKINQIQTILL
jgi:RNA polymerase sigma factor (sigma-70 family)